MKLKPFLLFALIGFLPNAHAYIDPGSGSFLLQMLFASIIGAGLTIKTYYQAIKTKIQSLFQGNRQDESSPDAQEDTLK